MVRADGRLEHERPMFDVFGRHYKQLRRGMTVGV